MKKNFLIQLIIFALITSCNGQNKQSSQTSATFTPVPNYPPCVTRKDNLSILPVLINGPTLLPNGLTLEEYSSTYVADKDWPRQQDSGCMYKNRNRATANHIHLKNGFEILTNRAIGYRMEFITVKRDRRTIYQTETYPYIYSGLIEAWGYSNHWVIEILTGEAQGVDITYSDAESLIKIQENFKEHIDIIQDGQSIKDLNGYERVYSFQVLNGKPFYFFEKGNKYWINYDGIETQLDYDYVTWKRPHPGIESFVFQFENMVVFYAGRGTENFQVVIGAFDN